jgi:hypothetical protein
MAKTNSNPDKVILSVWWDCKRIIYFELLLVGQSIMTNTVNNLKIAMQKKRPILANRKAVGFHRDKAKP